MRHSIWIAALLLMLGSCVETASAKPSAKSYLERGDLQLGKNNIDAAIISYTRAIELEPFFARAYVRRGIAQLSKGSLNGAIQDFETARKIDPQVALDNRHIAESYGNRGYVEMGDLRIDGAIEDFSKAIEFHRDANYFYRRGQARLIDENVPGAIADFDEALGLSPRNELFLSIIYANRGYAIFLQGNKNSAQLDFEKCLKGNSGQGLLIELDLRILEAQIKAMRQRRAEGKRHVVDLLTPADHTPSRRRRAQPTLQMRTIFSGQGTYKRTTGCGCLRSHI